MFFSRKSRVKIENLKLLVDFFLILKSTFNNYDIITLIIIDQFSCFLVEKSKIARANERENSFYPAGVHAGQQLLAGPLDCKYNFDFSHEGTTHRFIFFDFFDFKFLILKSTFNNYDIITLIIIDQFSCFLVENRAC